MPTENQEVNIRSEEVQEILSYVPNWMIRWGNTLVFSLMIGFLIISWFIKYPDIINTQATITTSNPPEKVYAKNGGKLNALLISDNEKINEDEAIAVIENSANYKDVLYLKSIIDTIKINYKNFYFPIEKLPILSLGDIDIDFALFENNYTEYILNKNLKPYSNDFFTNKLSISEIKNRLNTLVTQQSINKEELNIKKNNLKRYESLFEKGVISAQENEQIKLDYLQAERLYKSNNSSISQLKEVLYNSKNNLNNSKIKKQKEDVKTLKNVIQSYNQLKKSIKKWEINYILKSSINGTVSYLSYWSENQQINANDLIFTIVPENKGNFLAKIKAPTHNSGKIKKGQKVNIRLTNYPHTEFGAIEGTIKNISLLPDNEGNYLIDVKLPNQLITTYNKKLKFKQEMIGSAEIITEDLRLIERFFYQLKNIFNS